jgi:hypothetical protein
MSGKKDGHTKDLHKYSEKLGRDLTQSFINLIYKDNIYLGKWDRNDCSAILHNLIKEFNIKNLCSFHVLASEIDYVNQHQYKFYETLKNSNRKKIFIAHDGLKSMMSFLNASVMITVPKINAFDNIEEIKSKCLKEYVPDAIYIYCVGMNTKLLINHILENFNDSTHLDVGSAFEPFQNNKTRSKHISTDQLLNFYKNLL